jgi:hypothetical protein
LLDEPVLRRSGFPVAESEAIACELCELLFSRGKTESGRYAIEVDELPKAMGVSPLELQRALQVCVERAWVGYVGLMLTLRAGGIYVAKTALDLPR